jgi:UDP-N-acetylmuramoyl-L-alanyl-D-glutamate--2,6-diaminopimelate ligase
LNQLFFVSLPLPLVNDPGRRGPGAVRSRQHVSKEAIKIVSELRRLGVDPRGLAADSRALQRGEVFLAYPGERADGRRFIGQAAARGAAAVVWEREGFEWPAAIRVPHLAVDGLKRLAGPLGHEVYAHPSEKLWVVGVTGTNGKTSCSQWIAQALSNAGRNCAVIGTLGLGFPDRLEADPNTTPDAIVLQRALRRFLDSGAKVVAMEASSIGLDQGRLEGVRFACALFTNISRDHLDYHGDMERYAQAKMRLFRAQGLAHVVLNLDDPLGVRIAQSLAGSRIERIGYSLAAGAAAAGGLEHWLEARHIVLSDAGVKLTLSSDMGSADIVSPLIGRFNVANLLGAVGVLLASGESLADAARAAEQFEPPPGRMQRLGGGDQPLVVIDYAHTPDALDKALGALRDVARARDGKLVCVFGCGGERDRGKRPLMGAAASRHADYIIVTSDNPRSESPSGIIAEILPGVSIAHAIEVDRGAGIQAAISRARPGDVVLIAGKGHEPYQEIAGVRLPFSDLEEARRALTAQAP